MELERHRSPVERTHMNFFFAPRISITISPRGAALLIYVLHLVGFL
jgi:hypothetical protein